MILVTDVIDRIVSALDAEGSDRYSFDRDYRPAINYAIEFYIAVMNRVLGDDKLSEENLRELVKTKVWQTSQFSRIHFDPSDLNEEIWTIIRIAPEPVLSPATDPIINPTPENSIFIPDVTFVSSQYAARRLTMEEWNEKELNVFMPGNLTLADSSFKTYGYRNFATVRPGNIASEIIEEVEISPYLDSQLVAVTYLVYPELITADTDEILFPKTMLNLLVQKALNFISLKQGDGTNLYAVSQREVAQLVASMS